jgi:long-subunit fatty acid transport protein
MITWRVSMSEGHRAVAVLALCAGALGAGQAAAGGLIAYEVGTADVGLGAAGYSARAQDASTVLTNPAGMTRLESTQLLAAGQVLWGNTKFSIGSGTSPALGIAYDSGFRDNSSQVSPLLFFGAYYGRAL